MYGAEGIALTDNGCGIPKEDAERVFERFVKLDQFKLDFSCVSSSSQDLVVKYGLILVILMAQKSYLRTLINQISFFVYLYI